MDVCNSSSLVHAAQIGTNDDGTWFARCGCGELVCKSGTEGEANTVLVEHRAARKEAP